MLHPARTGVTLCGVRLAFRPDGACRAAGLVITPRPVVHTSCAAYGYLIGASGTRTARAPESLEFPSWAAGADLMFAEAAGWRGPSVSPRARAGTLLHLR